MIILKITRQSLTVLLFSLTFLSNFVFAQDFNKAPVPNVKTIVEWVKTQNNDQVAKGFTYHFDKKGNLKQFDSTINKDFPAHGKFQFDEQDRPTLSEITYGARYETTEYVYENKKTITFFFHKGNEHKTLYFYGQNNKLLETKTFLDSMDQDKGYLLIGREIYNYNEKDSLKGITHYTYEKDFKKPFLAKTLIHYDKKTGKRNHIEHLGLDGNQYSYHFIYNKKGKLIQQTLKLQDGSMDVTTYKYKKNQLYLETHITANYVIKKIYKKGRLIRKRSQWMGMDWEILDYQYVF